MVFLTSPKLLLFLLLALPSVIKKFFFRDFSLLVVLFPSASFFALRFAVVDWWLVSRSAFAMAIFSSLVFFLPSQAAASMVSAVMASSAWRAASRAARLWLGRCERVAVEAWSSRSCLRSAGVRMVVVRSLEIWACFWAAASAAAAAASALDCAVA